MLSSRHAARALRSHWKSVLYTITAMSFLNISVASEVMVSKGILTAWGTCSFLNSDAGRTSTSWTRPWSTSVFMSLRRISIGIGKAPQFFRRATLVARIRYREDPATFSAVRAVYAHIFQIRHRGRSQTALQVHTIRNHRLVSNLLGHFATKGG